MKALGILQFFVLLLLLTGCSNQPEQGELFPLPEATVPIDSTKDDIHNAIFSDSIIHTKVVYFSGGMEPDTFKLVVPAGKIFETQSTFTIIDADGKVLFQQSFGSYTLGSGYNLPPNPTQHDIVEWTQESADNFLGDINFEKIAENNYIANADTLDFLDYKTWEEVRSLSSTRIFVFGLGEEDISYLVYSPSKQKVVSIISCC